VNSRIVITGIGAVTPVGIGKESFWNALTSGTSGIDRISLFDASEFRSKYAAQIRDLDHVRLPGRRASWASTRGITSAVAGAKLALEDAQIDVTSQNAPHIGVVFGATLAGLDLMSRFDQQSIREGPRTCDPGMFPDTGFSAPACRVSVVLGIHAFNATLSNGQTSSLDAINYAVRFLRTGRARIVLVGGVEELSYENFLGYYREGLLSMSSDEPTQPCRPFDRRRNGIILGEGSAVLVLENHQDACARGARVLAEILGYGTSFDSRSLPSRGPSVRSASGAMRAALAAAEIGPEQVDVIYCNANSSPRGDLTEARAIARIFGRKSQPHLTAIKSMLGESYSAAGAMQAAASALTLYHHVIPPTINCEQQDPHCVNGALVISRRPANPGIALVNSFGCNGNSASLVMGRVN
jgi:3-oxoacyl-[acyl-carrier-protein] synthase II